MTNTAILQRESKDINLRWYKYLSLIKRNRKRLKDKGVDLDEN